MKLFYLSATAIKLLLSYIVETDGRREGRTQCEMAAGPAMQAECRSIMQCFGARCRCGLDVHRLRRPAATSRLESPWTLLDWPGNLQNI